MSKLWITPAVIASSPRPPAPSFGSSTREQTKYIHANFHRTASKTKKSQYFPNDFSERQQCTHNRCHNRQPWVSNSRISKGNKENQRVKVK